MVAGTAESRNPCQGEAFAPSPTLIEGTWKPSVTVFVFLNYL